MNVKTWLFALAFTFSSLAICSLAQSQSDWRPAAFATSAPQTFDQTAGTSSYQSMSPDNWGQPLRRASSVQPATGATYAAGFRPAIPQNVQMFVAAQQNRAALPLNIDMAIPNSSPASFGPEMGPVNQIVYQPVRAVQAQPLAQRDQAVSQPSTAKRSSIVNSQTFYVRKSGN